MSRETLGKKKKKKTGCSKVELFSWIQKEWGRCVNVQAGKLLQEHEQNNPQSGEKLWIRLFFTGLYIFVLYSVQREPNAAYPLMWNRLGTAMSFISCLLSALTEGSEAERLNTSSWFRAWLLRHFCDVPARPRQLYCLAEQRQVMFNKVALEFESVILQPFNTSRFTFNWRYDWLMLIWWKKAGAWSIRVTCFLSILLPVSFCLPTPATTCWPVLLWHFGIWQLWLKWRRIIRPFIDFDFRDQHRSCFKKKKEA